MLVISVGLAVTLISLLEPLLVNDDGSSLVVEGVVGLLEPVLLGLTSLGLLEPLLCLTYSILVLISGGNRSLFVSLWVGGMIVVVGKKDRALPLFCRLAVAHYQVYLYPEGQYWRLLFETHVKERET